MNARSPSTLLIANPVAGRGRALRMLPHVRDALASRGVTTVQMTECPGDERRLAEAATRDGVHTIIALGGDGTWGNAARGILAAGGTSRLAILAAGTGNDLAFASGIPAHDVRAALDIALGTSERRLDVGAADSIHFLNCLGFGFDAEVVRSVSTTKWVRGHAVYVATALRHLVRFEGIRLRVGANAPNDYREALMVVISNGPRFGGGFMIAPGARNDDGALDMVTVRNASAARRVRLLAAAMRGAHIGAPEVSLERVRDVVLAFEAPPIFEADGELHQATSAQITVKCLRGALRLACAR